MVLAQPFKEGTVRKDENEVDGVSVLKGQSGSSSCCPGGGGNKDHLKASDKKVGRKGSKKKNHLSQTKKPEENPSSKFSSVRKYAAISIGGEDENEEDYTK